MEGFKVFNELDKVVFNKKDKKLLIRAMINYPVTLDIILDMVKSGLEACIIYEICTRWHIEGMNINLGWKGLKMVLPIVK